MCNIEFGVRIDDDVFSVSPTLFDMGRHLYHSVVILRDKEEKNITIVGEIFTERNKEDDNK